MTECLPSAVVSVAVVNPSLGPAEKTSCFLRRPKQLPMTVTLSLRGALPRVDKSTEATGVGSCFQDCGGQDVRLRAYREVFTAVLKATSGDSRLARTAPRYLSAVKSRGCLALQIEGLLGTEPDHPLISPDTTARKREPILAQAT
jgi:hypothetical protein